MMVKKDINLINNKLLTVIITAIMIIVLFSPLLHMVSAEQEPPSSFTATATSRFSIYLTWTNSEQNNTYIEWNSSQTWNLGEGFSIYNGNNTNYNHVNLDPGTPYYYQAWSYNTTNNSFSSTYLSDQTTTFSNNIPSFGTPSPNNGAINQPLALTWSISITDGDGDLFDWTIECSNSQTNSQNNDINGTKQLPLSGLDYNTYYTVWVNATDGYDSANATYGFTTRGKYTPSAPGNFIATANGQFRIDLSWTKGTNANKTYIRYKQGTPPTDRNDGNFLYNGTGNSKSVIGLASATTYGFKAWSWNETDNVWSTTSSTTSATTDANQNPTQTDENPTDNSVNIPITQPTVSVTIEDADGDTFNWTIEGQYVTNNGADYDTNGTKSANLFTPLPFNTNIIWYVNVTDGYSWNNTTYDFTTRSQYIPNPPGSFTATPFNRTQIDITWIKGTNADKTYIEWNTIGSWTKGDGNFLYNDTGTATSHINLDYNTQYFYQAWSWNNTDNVWSTTSAASSATTGTNNAPTITGESPANNSINIPFNPLLTVIVDDADGDILDVYWYSNVSGSWDIFEVDLNIDTSSGPVNLEQTNDNFIEYYTTYWWSVNCYDGTDWTNETYDFTRSVNNPPSITNPYPSNGLTDVEPKPVCNVTISDANKDSMTVHIYENTTFTSDILSYQISDDVDDAYYYNTRMTEDKDYITINYENYTAVTTMAGLRFRNVQIPQGATITGANLYVHIYDKWTADDYDDAYCKLYGDYADDSPAIEGSTGQDELVNRTLTTANVPWYENNLGDSWAKSPDVSNIIQEIVNRSGWTIGNNITIISNDSESDERFRIWDYQYDDHTWAAKINITYITDLSLWRLQQTNYNAASGSNVVWNNFVNASKFNTKYWWSVNATDGNSWTNETFHFTTREQYIPNPPDSLTATSINSQQINLEWNKGNKADYTRIQRGEGGYPITITDGTNVYLSTGTSYSDIIGLVEGTTYYYSAWSYNTTDNVWSPTYATVSGTTKNKPMISNPIPESGSAGVGLIPQMNITVNDADGDLMTINWYSDSDSPGSWQIFGTNVSCSNGTYHQTNSNFSNYDKKYWWYVTVNDDADTNTSDLFYFIVNNRPMIDNPGPYNGSIGVNLVPQMNISVSDFEGDLMTINWYSNSNGSWEIFGTDKNVNNGTYHQTNSNFSDFYTKYYWYVTVNDGKSTNTSSIFHFTTNNKPMMFNPGPSNESINIRKRPQMNITVEDPDGDLMTINWYSDSDSPGSWQIFATNSTVTNGTYHQINQNFNVHNTTYWWYVEVSDGKNTNISDMYHFTTAANKVPLISGERPFNGAVKVCYSPMLNVTVDDLEDDPLNIYWLSNSTGAWAVFATNLSVDNSKGPVNVIQTNNNFNGYNTTYWWSVNISDEADWKNETYSFTTSCQPTISDVFPVNNSILDPKPVCSVKVSDDDNDLMDVYFYENSTFTYSTFNSKISNDADDAYYYGEMKNDGFEVVINNLGTNQLRAGLRFRNVQIPQGATITNAYLRVRVYIDESGFPDFTFYGHDIDDSPVIEGSTGQDILINRALTTASVQWVDDDLSSEWTTSPDISSIIQEIVNRPGWKKGNNITILTNDIQSAKKFSITDYQIGASYGAELNVSFSESVWTLQQTNTNVQSDSTLIWNNFSNASLFSKKYWWSARVFDGCSWKNETYYFTTRNAIIPDPPLSLTALTYDKDKINLTWENGDNNTYIEYHFVESWAPYEGTFLLNTNTHTKLTHGGLIPGTKYYYQAWGFNTTDQSFSSTYLSADATTLPNSPPEFSNEDPEYEKSDENIYYPEVSIDINDSDGESFNWTIEGKYIDYNSSNDDSNGRKSANLITPLPFDTSVIWFVNATDSYVWTNETYIFRTREEYVPDVPTDFTVATHNRTQINLNWINTGNYTYIELNTMESWARGSGILLENTSVNTSFNHSNLETGTKYYYQAWRYNSTDNVFSVDSVSLNATTIANNPPIYGQPSAINGTGSHDLEFDWTISITDADDDLLVWTIQCSNGQDNLSIGDTSGVKQLELSGLSEYTTYKVWVNATDGFDTKREWYKFITESPYEPPVPTNFVATSINKTQINLTWNNDGNNYTRIESYTSQNWAPGDGTILYNSPANTYFLHKNLDPGTQYFYQAWSYNDTYDVLSNYVESNATTFPNKAPSLGTPSPINGAINQPNNITWSITITDPDGEAFDWTIERNNTQFNSSNNDINGTKKLSLIGLAYNTYYTIWVNVTDGYDSVNATYGFTTRYENILFPPSGFSANANGQYQINLYWTKGINADKTYIRYKPGSPPTDRSDGTFLYNGTGNSKSVIGLASATTYGFKAWSWSDTDKIWSTSYASVTATTEGDEEPPFDPPEDPIDDFTPPSRPTNVKCTTPEDDNTPRFTWNAATDDKSEIRGYYVKIDDGSDIWIGNQLSWTATSQIEDGAHTFSVKAEDASNNLNKGSYGSCTFTIKTTSEGNPPVAEAGGPYYGLTYQAITFDGTRSYDPDGSIVSGIWDFGDDETATGTKPTFTFTEAGEFNVTLTVTDNDGLTSTDIANVYILLDSDRDGWSDDIENSYGTDANNSDDQPLDTDGDGIPDNHSPDKKYVGDSDDDNDGLRDDYEKTLGSDPKNYQDVTIIEIDNKTYYLVDITGDGIKDIFYNNYNQTSTQLGYGTNGTYLVDMNGDSTWDYIYNPANGEIKIYKEQPKDAQMLPLIEIAVIAIVAAAILILVYLFKIGYFYIEYLPKEKVKHKKKKTKKNKK